jgi:hypothetical protein
MLRQAVVRTMAAMAMAETHTAVLQAREVQTAAAVRALRRMIWRPLTSTPTLDRAVDNTVAVHGKLSIPTPFFYSTSQKQ